MPDYIKICDACEKLYQLCRKNHYFTCGSPSQYRKFFHMAEQGANAHDLALIVWLCSDKVDKNIIEREIEEIFPTEMEVDREL